MKTYPSKYSNGRNVTPAQYIAELVCERVAKKLNKDLHYRFWVNPEWEKEYSGQIAAAYKLLKAFDDKAIVNGLLTAQGLKIYSLRAPHLIDIIKKQQAILDNTPKPKPQIIERNFLATGRINTVRHNILDKLKDLDHDQDNTTTG